MNAYPKYVYAIYPYDENGDVAGVYIGLTSELKSRLKNHLNNHSPNDSQKEMHYMMRENGYEHEILGVVREYEDRYLEYTLIRTFMKYSNLRVFNIITDRFSKEEV